MERRKSAVRQAQRVREVKRMKAAMVIAALLAIVFITGICRMISAATKAEKKPENTLEVSAMAAEPETEEKKAVLLPEDPYRTVYPYNTMSADWGGEDVVGFVYYEIPEDYAFYGGLLPQIVQVYTYILCNDYSVNYETVLAMIEIESGYKWNAESRSGALGYMQVIPEYHAERQTDDLKNPYQNIRAGIKYLSELLEEYSGSYEKALTAYKCGPTGAQRNYFSAGKTSCEYSEKVLEVTERIRQQLESEIVQ